MADETCPVCGGELKGKAEVGDPGGEMTTVFSCGARCGRFIVDAEGMALLGGLSRFSRRRLAGLLRMNAARSDEPFELTVGLIEGDAD